MNIKNRKTVLVIVVIAAILLIAIVGATFAYFSAVITENDKTQTRLHSADLGVEFESTQEIDATGIEPGWRTDKKFTVENTSDYEMSFDINFTKVVNNFTRTTDLAAIASAEFVDSDHIGDTVEMIGLNDVNLATSTRVDFAFPNENSYTLPVDGTVNNSTTPPTITRGSQVFKAARVVIPAHSKQEFTITFSYIYLSPTPGYTLGSQSDPNNQTVDKGKIFKATIDVTVNGINSGTSQDSGSGNEPEPQAQGFNPVYYEFGDPTTLSSTIPPEGKDTYVAMDASGNKAVCVIKDGETYCFQGYQPIDEREHLRTVFDSLEDSNCSVREDDGMVDCSTNPDVPSIACYTYQEGGIGCNAYNYDDGGYGSQSCYVWDDGSAGCY